MAEPRHPFKGTKRTKDLGDCEKAVTKVTKTTQPHPTKKPNLKRKVSEAYKNYDFTELDTLYHDYKTEASNDDQCACMLIGLAITKGDIPCALKMVWEIYESFKLKSEALYTAIIRALVSCDELEKAFEVLADLLAHLKPHVRTFAPFFETKLSVKRYVFLIELMRDEYDLLPNLELFTSMWMNIPRKCPYEVAESMLRCVSDNYHEVPEELAESVGAYYGNVQAGLRTVDKHTGHCTICQTHLTKLDITDKQRTDMLDCLKFEGLAKIKEHLETNAYDIIIDGENVARYNNTEFMWQKLDSALSKLNADKKVLVVFKSGFQKKINAIPQRKNVKYYFSPHGNDPKNKEDDDLTWLYATLALNGDCVTDDKMGDHMYYKFSQAISPSIFEKWVECHVVRYALVRNSFTDIQLFWPSRYSQRIQISAQDQIHIPVLTVSKKNVWFCVQGAFNSV